MRIGLSIIGVTPFQIHLAGVLTSILNNFIITLSYCVFGYLLDFKFFSNSVLWFIGLVMLTQGVSL